MNWYTYRYGHDNAEDVSTLDIKLRRWHPGYWVASLRMLFGGNVVIDCTR